MVIFALLLLCLTCTFAVPPNVDFFAGRSADIIVKTSAIQDSVVFFKGDQISTTQLSALDDTRFADLFAHVMGTQPFHVDADRSGFPTTSLFNKPKAALVVAIDSVGAETLNSFSTLSLFQNSHAASITTQSSPANTLSLLANVATGTTPSAHGIVGASWRKPVTGEYVNAYDVNGLPFSANIADILLQETTGRSLVISASASSSFASALAAHPELISENLGWAAHAYSLLDGAFVSRYEEPSCDQALALSAAELSALLSDVTVAVGNEQITFSAKTPEDLALLAELTFVSNLIAKLSSNDVLSALVKDNVPDLYSFTFSSLKGIQSRYGAKSAAFAAALTLVDKATDSLLTALNGLYESRVATAIVALNARDTSSEALKQKVYDKISTLLYNDEDFAIYYPVLYVGTSGYSYYARERLCSGLQDTVSKDATILCMTSILPSRRARSLGDTNGTNNNTNPYAKSDTATIWAFWLNFWVTIIIVCFVGWGVYNLTYVGSDASKDSLLFRATGRHHHQN